VSAVGRTWHLWAHRYKSGEFWHVGARPWVELHRVACPIVSVLVQEILGDPYAEEVTHYAWQYAAGSRYRHDDVPTMIQVRTGNDPTNPKRARMLLDMCFPHGVDATVARGDGAMVALRITEQPETT
jgi:hypothetical protein